MGFSPTNLTFPFALAIAGGRRLISYPDAAREHSERTASSPCHAQLYRSPSHIVASLSAWFLSPVLSSSFSEQNTERWNPPRLFSERLSRYKHGKDIRISISPPHTHRHVHARMGVSELIDWLGRQLSWQLATFLHIPSMPSSLSLPEATRGN